MRLCNFLASVVLALGLAAGPAGAVTVKFTGTVGTGLGSIGSGATLMGSYSFDPLAPALFGSNSVTAVYNALTALDFSVDGYSANFAGGAGGPEIQVGNQGSEGMANETTDRYAVVTRASDGLSGPALDGTFVLNTFGFRLDDAGGTALTTALVLPTNPRLGDFQSGEFFIFFTGGETLRLVDGTLTSLQVIPLPAPLLLLLSAIGGLGLVGRRCASA